MRDRCHHGKASLPARTYVNLGHRPRLQVIKEDEGCRPEVIQGCSSWAGQMTSQTLQLVRGRASTEREARRDGPSMTRFDSPSVKGGRDILVPVPSKPSMTLPCRLVPRGLGQRVISKKTCRELRPEPSAGCRRQHAGSARSPRPCCVLIERSLGSARILGAIPGILPGISARPDRV